MAMTAAERAAAHRKRLAAAGGSDRLNIITSADTVKRLRLYADYHEMTQSDVLNMLVESFWGTISDEDKQAMDKHAVVLEEKRRARLAGDNLTGDLFADVAQ